jgi:hypothetical protein
VKVRNIEKIRQQLRQHREETSESIRRGLLKVGLFVQREGQLLSPVDTGNMRGSFNTRLKRTARSGSVKVVVTAAYAIYVHENEHSHHPVGEAKFLSKAVSRNLSRITTIFRNEFK